MNNPPYLVIRLVPESPVDGATFSTYLNDLKITVLDAYTGQAISAEADVSPLALTEWPAGSGGYLTSATQTTSAPTSYVAPSGDRSYNYGNSLQFATTDGISVGALVYSADQATIPPGANLAVTAITPTAVTLNGNLPGNVPAGTVVSFVGYLKGVTTVTTQQPPVAEFSCAPVSGTPADGPTTLDFPSGATHGVPVGARLNPVRGLVPAGTTVIGATGTTLTLSAPLKSALSADSNASITLTFDLSSGIIQHTQQIPLPWNFFFGEQYSIIPAAAATALITLNQTPPGYLDIKISATRGQEAIPDSTVYYNVQVQDDPAPPSPAGYQGIPAADTSLYFFLPPPPTSATIRLAMPADGTPPDLAQVMLPAITAALANETLPGVTPATLINSATQCRRIAYDIVWSYQHDLPPLPDPLESLYTNPPNAGGGIAGGDGSGSGTSSFEMDRQKFEGALNSFYSQNNAAAERLTKFVAAASGALACEQLSRAATSALLEFPVDPAGPAVTFATAVDSEVLLTGLGDGGPAGLGFGVPAAFFYALGANLDKTTTAAQRFQLATGDGIDRLLTQFAAALDAGLIDATGPQPFSDGSTGITMFQAARRLAALGVSAASSSPPVSVVSGTPLASLVTAWLDAVDPDISASPPPGYQYEDFIIWAQQLAVHQAAGCLQLDLEALTQGYVIPPSAASPAAPAVTLADQITAWLPSTVPGPAQPPTVETLRQVTAAQWTDFFMTGGGPQWLPPFTAPAPGTSAAGAPQAGYVAARIRAFVRAVQRFFTVSTATTVPSLSSANAIPCLSPPQFDPIGAAASELSFDFGAALPDQAVLAGAAQGLLPGDAPAQAWLVSALTTINELWLVAGGGPAADNPPPAPVRPSMLFAVMESLYARGFARAADITALSLADFTRALTGTIAYESAGDLYSNAQHQAAGGPADRAVGTGFQPVNDGSVVNCVPPPSLSPTGPIAYLQEMLAVSPLSTSADPAAATLTAPTLGTLLGRRRGPVGDLTASAANLHTPVPLVDLVNECLEFLAAAAEPAGGTVYDTPPEAVPDADEDAGLARLLAASPAHSTPAVPAPGNAGPGPAAFSRLASDFSSGQLPYSQALDVSRTYLAQLGSSRFEGMRTFRRSITEFVLDPEHEPAGFEPWLWRYPVRTDIAIEYLGLSPQEYQALYRDGQDQSVPDGRVTLPDFLALTCLSYCEFYDLWACGYVPFRDGAAAPEGDGAFPRCEPCYLEQAWLEFPGQSQEALARLLVFVRLWRTLRESRPDGCSFSDLRDICEVLRMSVDGSPNPDFIRQLAAFQLLRDEFGLPLTDPAAPVVPGATGADRTHLLALWAGPAAARWPWAVHELIAGAERHARTRGHEPRSQAFLRLLTANLDPLSRLAGFDPDSAEHTWHALAAGTLRFAEVLAKICASALTVGELIFAFTADPHLDGDDPFPLTTENEALDDPLALPQGESGHGLWRLREELLAAEAPDDDEDDDEDGAWPWRRIETVLETEFGFAGSGIIALGWHFFPRVLARDGRAGAPADECFTSDLPSACTVAAMWNSLPDSPFRYDPVAQRLSAHVPLGDRAVLTTLTAVRDLGHEERTAVQDLYLQPRAMLAGFALLFPDFTQAQRALIEEPDEDRRFAYFRRQFLTCLRRARLIAGHLSRHVAAVTGCQAPGQEEAAFLVRALAADENSSLGSWEADTGSAPPLTWPRPHGGALAALLGLTGTGVSVEYRPVGGPVTWRDQAAGLSGFGAERDQENCPVPTVLPALDAALTLPQLRQVSVHNGLLMNDTTGAWLGGALGFEVTWTGALLIEQGGDYEFWAGSPAPDEEPPGHHPARHQRWRVVLRRGQRDWVILSHHWDGEEERPAASLPLRRGTYQLTVEFSQAPPEHEAGEVGETSEDVCRAHTGFQVKYRGPDSRGRRTQIPHHALFTVAKDGTLRDGIEGLSPGAAAYLDGLYRSSLRDIRRTYQRAFKALLLCERLELSARRQPHGTSELGYLLSQPGLFAGASYYSGTSETSGYLRHAADLDFDFLPVRDGYHPPPAAADQRACPSVQRVQALFDWWERLTDYAAARADVRHRAGRHLWHLFEEARDRQPVPPDPLLRHLGADARHWPLELRYFQDQASAVYDVTSADLADERWVLRAWHADRWLRAAQRRFAATGIEAARPDLWASDDPGTTVPGASQAGNAGLLAYVTGGCLGHAGPRRYDDLCRLNDGLRERGRRALTAYLCQRDRVPLPWQPGAYAASATDLSSLLLLDVEAGLREQASRIEDACAAAQALVSRIMLGLEPGWPVTREFRRLWQDRFQTYQGWQRARRRELYRENWIGWDEVAGARRVEAFRFLESRLRSATLTMAAPGGLDWWTDDYTDLADAPGLLQRREPSSLLAIPPGQPSSGVEGLTVLGLPRRAAQPSWLATVPPSADGVRELTAAAESDASGPAETLPLWLQAAARFGTGFVRVAAAGIPDAAGGPGRDEGQRGEVDEYYFWLVSGLAYDSPADSSSSPDGGGSFDGTYESGFQDPYYDQVQQQSTAWDDDSQVPSLLAQWQPERTVRLAWARVRDGEFGQPRRSQECVAVTQQPVLTFQGRGWDSLYFGLGAGSASGFRYDLAADDAVALPEVIAAPQPELAYPGHLPSYPFFAYHSPGARLFPASRFATSVTVAGALRTRCEYDLALRWYRRSFDPLAQDCSWVVRGADATQVTAAGAQDRAVVMDYCRTLVEWGDALMRRGRSPEAAAQARVLYDTAERITGPRPRTIMAPERGVPVRVAAFVPASAPLNPRLMELYDLVADRRELVRQSVSAERLPNGRLGRDMPYFDQPGAQPNPYRFQSQIRHAIELAGRVRELGTALLSAYEKRDAEYLASMRAEQERELNALAIAIGQDQWRDADWQVQALQQTKDVSQANLLYYAALYNTGLLNNENQHVDLTIDALATRTGANLIESVGEVMNIIPDPFVGALSSGVAVPAGTKLAHLFEAIGRIMNAVADIMSTTAALDLTQAEWQRRAVDWLHQTQTLPIEIQQIEMQILGAHRRRDQALRALNSQQRQVEHAAEVLDFLRDKFTAAELYLWLQQETAALYRQLYEVALRAAGEAERAFNFELRHGEQRFLPDEAWADPHAGLLAGERLDLALRRMEQAYLDQNKRELELTKHLSLRLAFPLEYLRLRVTGYCEISVPEWMFDLDYPGHYLRRLHAVRMTVPMTASPLTGVHARLTLLSSMTRVSREASGQDGEDPRVSREYGAREAIVTSEGRDDSGLFELSIHDERYLPFEYQGAVSRWRIELPPENNYFDLDTVTDLVLHLSYTAREGGPALRQAASEQARGRLPGDGLRFFDVRHDFPDAWPGLGGSAADTARPEGPRQLRLGFTPAMFPFVPGRPACVIDRLMLLFAAPGAEPGRHHVVRFLADATEPGPDRYGHGEEIECVADAAWPGFFRGVVDLRDRPLGPLRADRPAYCLFELPADAGEIGTAFVLASYDVSGDGATASRPRRG
jgi:Tc toxin complex TcA C-terminal TcB-binding domain